MSDCAPISAEDDGLLMPEVGAWSEKKYRLLAAYAQVFATSMKDKWSERIYLDLFAGAGKAFLRGTAKVVLTSPLLALSVKNRFDRYVFCEEDAERMGALQDRVGIFAPTASVTFVNSDANDAVEQVLAGMPRPSRDHTALAFCFVDPYNLSNLKFDTIKALSTRFVDFLVHLPAMDPRRNEKVYRGSNEIVDLFLGDSLWRAEWTKIDGRIPFDLFVANQFALRMTALKYSYSGIEESVLVRSIEKNLRLYRLAFFSRNPLAAKFWKEIKKCTEEQIMLSFDHGAADEHRVD